MSSHSIMLLTRIELSPSFYDRNSLRYGTSSPVLGFIIGAVDGEVLLQIYSSCRACNRSNPLYFISFVPIFIIGTSGLPANFTAQI